MFSPTRKMLRAFPIAVLLFVMTTGCSNQKPAPFEPESQVLRDDREAPFNPQERYPGWAFDQPEFMQPTNALDSELPIRGDDPNHFFTNDCVVLIEQPTGYTPEEIPRIAVYRSDDNGFTWKRDGMFGREQGYYALETHADGDYGIRFVGPGQELAERTPADPQRVYHVDTQPPEVEIEINPEKTWYRPGDQVKIAWAARDPHLIANPVRLGMLMDFTGDIRNLVELQRDLADEGSMTYRIMPNSAGRQIVFRIEALDRADNLGLAYSHHLQVIDQEAEQIVKKNERRPHDDRMPDRPNAPRTVPVQPNRTRTMETMTPISHATPSEKEKSITIEAAAQPNTPTVISAVSTTNEAVNPVAPTSSIQSIMRPEREPEHKSLAIRTKSAEGNRPPKMTAMTIAPGKVDTVPPVRAEPASVATTKTDAEPIVHVASTTSTLEKQNKAIQPADAAQSEAMMASFKDAFSKIATTVATAAEKAQQQEQAADKARATTPAELKVVQRPAMAQVNEPTAKPTRGNGTTTAKIIPVTARTSALESRSSEAASNASPLSVPQNSSLVAPMPGVVANDSTGAPSHPWRSLGNKPSNSKTPIWTLPSDKPTLRGQPTIRVVEQPTRSKKVFAGTPTEDETPVE